jgi:broad specificity phosphatase PhoE
MLRKIRYLSHPQVSIDPDVEIQNWSLNETGRKRVQTLAKSNALFGTTTIISSAETKALETATPLADALSCALLIREDMHENDRSSTGFLPPDEFETVADQFFAHPDLSVRGWETAIAAQTRIVKEINMCLRLPHDGDLLFVGHGGVGTLLYCYLSGLPISREYDHGAGGGGCYFEFSNQERRPTHRWRPLEDFTTD